jgi:hypothetical protein
MRLFDEPEWIIDAHRGDGKRFAVLADELADRVCGAPFAFTLRVE